jgi:pimeloyl-ACP methyl ester carboxylesterase
MTLYWQESGPKDAPTLVFLHGMGVSSWMWTEQVEALQTAYHCLTIDLPGNGNSHTRAWQSLRDSAEAVAELIHTHATHGKAHIVGLSLGGYVAVTLLAEHPEVVDSVVVSGMSGTPFRLSWAMKGVMRLLPALMQWEFFVKLQARMLQLPPEALAAFIQDNKVLTPPIYQRIYDEVLTFQLPAELATRPHRLLAVAGDKEAQEIKAGLAEFGRVLPHAVAKVAPNVHHGWNGENPYLFNAMVRAWVEGKPLPTELMETGTPSPIPPIPQMEH